MSHAGARSGDEVRESDRANADDDAERRADGGTGPMAAEPFDDIRLTLPCEPQYGRIARIAAAALALRAGFDYPEIEDLRIVMDEALIALLRPEGSPGDLTIRFSVSAEHLDIVAQTTAGADQHWIDAGARTRFERLAGELVEVAEIDEAGRRVHVIARHS